ncbi:peptidase S8/S53 domain-containing protein [Tanacetum coccineum]|uniref:Peptidase S8/S53 domain-containing protein n=1 Tax=Tanacetum coccineum TaxID=301880 RepID=A0ABQ5GQW7_9ASTR
MGFHAVGKELKLIDVMRIRCIGDVDVLVGSAMGEAVLPSSHVGYREGVAIKKYLNSTSAPVATIIQRGTVLGVNRLHCVTVFSLSRGPNIASPGILKPDIVGPGVDILADWHKSVDNNTDEERSSLQTYLPLAWSRGVSKANDPGLILDIKPDDYIPYLCGLGYTPKQVQIIVKKTVSCSKTIPEAQLNYPSFVVELKRCERKEYTRILTNVGWENSTYTIGDISPPQGVDIEVLSHSQQLSFTALHQSSVESINICEAVRIVYEKKGQQANALWLLQCLQKPRLNGTIQELVSSSLVIVDAIESESDKSLCFDEQGCKRSSIGGTLRSIEVIDLTNAARC